ERRQRAVRVVVAGEQRAVGLFDAGPRPGDAVRTGAQACFQPLRTFESLLPDLLAPSPAALHFTQRQAMKRCSPAAGGSAGCTVSAPMPGASLRASVSSSSRTFSPLRL